MVFAEIFAYGYYDPRPLIIFACVVIGNLFVIGLGILLPKLQWIHEPNYHDVRNGFRVFVGTILFLMLGIPAILFVWNFAVLLWNILLDLK